MRKFANIVAIENQLAQAKELVKTGRAERTRLSAQRTAQVLGNKLIAAMDRLSDDELTAYAQYRKNRISK